MIRARALRLFVEVECERLFTLDGLLLQGSILGTTMSFANRGSIELD